jgi:NADH:ubiquinone oxidoreductase subunit 5 (subunit L)/multisubunit Na+/H+ antiporter MnhA subunit
MFLDYLALVILIAGLTLVFYAFIYIHDLPHKIAKKRHHPHEEAIHVACWLSLLTLHAIWPFIYIWAVMHPKTEEDAAKGKAAPFVGPAKRLDVDLGVRLGRLEERLKMAGVLDSDGN